MNIKISNTNNIDTKFQTQNMHAKGEEIAAVLNSEMTSLKNTYAGVGNKNTTKWALVKIVLFVAIYYLQGNIDRFTFGDTMANIIKPFCIMAMCYLAYSLIYSYVCIVGGHNTRKIVKFSKAFDKAVDQAEKNSVIQDVKNSVVNNQEYRLPDSNSLGDKVITIRENMSSCATRLSNLHKYSSYIVGPILIVMSFVLLKKSVGKLTIDFLDSNAVLNLCFFGVLLFVGAKSTLVTFSEKLGNISRIVGILVAAIYSFICWKSMTSLTMEWAFASSLIHRHVTFSMVIEILVALGLILALGVTNYKNENERIEQNGAAGFGYDNRSDIMIRVCTSVAAILAMFCALIQAVNMTFVTEEGAVTRWMLVGVCFFIANPLLKSSTLKDLWGRTVSIGQAIALLGMVVMYLATYNNIELISYLFFAVVGWLLSALAFLIITRVRISMGWD